MNNQAAINPWVVKLKRVDIPLAAYMVTFLGWEYCVYDAKDGKGAVPKWRWRFSISHGPHAGVELTSMTDRSIHSSTTAGRLIEGLIGSPLKAGDNVKALVHACDGKPYLAAWGKGPKGGLGVQSVSTPPAM